MYLWGVLAILCFEWIFISLFLLPLPSRFKILFTRLINSNKNIFYIIGSILLVLLAGTTIEMGRFEEKYQDSAEGSAGDFLQAEHLKLMKFRTERNFYLKAFAFTLMLILFGLMKLTTYIASLEAKLHVLKQAKTTPAPNKAADTAQKVTKSDTPEPKAPKTEPKASKTDAPAPAPAPATEPKASKTEPKASKAEPKASKTDAPAPATETEPKVSKTETPKAQGKVEVSAK